MSFNTPNESESVAKSFPLLGWKEINFIGRIKRKSLNKCAQAPFQVVA